MRKLQVEQEMLQDPPSAMSKTRNSRSSLFSRSTNNLTSVGRSSNSLTRSASPRRSSPRHLATSNRHLPSASSARNLKSGYNKLDDLFENHFSYSQDDIQKILGSSSATASSSMASQRNLADTSNQNPLIQELKTVLKTQSEEIITLREKCVLIEERYKDATITASQELQQSMNILFQLQQKSAHLEDSSSRADKLEDDLKVMKLRLAAKDKERRAFKAEVEAKEKKIQEQALELKELSSMLGGSGEELAQMNMDAKRTNSLWEELSETRKKLKDLKAENSNLKSRLEQSGSTHDVNLAPGSSNDIQAMEKVMQGLYDEIHRKNEQLSRQSKEIEMLRKLLDEKSGDEVEKSLRKEAEERARQEQQNRLAAEAEWNKLSEQVEEEMELSRRQLEEVVVEKSKLEKQLDEYRSGRMATASASTPKSALWELENTIVEWQAETRKAQISLNEARGNAMYWIRVYVCVRDAAVSKSSRTSEAIPFMKLLSDGMSLKVTASGSIDTGEATNGASEQAVHKFIYDKVLNANELDLPSQLAVSLDECLDHSISGHHAAVLSCGQTSSKRADIIFGTSKSPDSGLLYILLDTAIGKLRSVDSGAMYEAHVSFIRIHEEVIQDMFGGNMGNDSAHEIKKNADGSVSITNITKITLNLRDNEQISAIASQVRNGFTSQSSESVAHFLFALHITGTRGSENVSGHFTLGHLGGVEKISQSRSLQCFLDIFNAISKRQAHIPYRNTKLTYVLQPCLSTSGKMALVCDVDGGDPSAYETSQATLSLANQVYTSIVAPLPSMSSNRLSKNIDMVRKGTKTSSKGSSTGKPGPAKFKINLV
eukprot:CAMPEP_0185025764 /NCGR_PEP_ID=MMETSP1103-20130426/9150_1 /TAXON_ID=36769 /ORGANISM="Paraphysomonas bandaiensis, Strain Caron Lab Isolate" /LENGTH=826 /DNA_ID=CAMNT_0027559079 /DNA_START=89 /DNA_END=2569 /DNA_ORIENTATION=+